MLKEFIVWLGWVIVAALASIGLTTVLVVGVTLYALNQS